MPNVQEVIDGLEMSYTYSNVDEDNTLVPQQIVLDALALLKAQEASAMTLEELANAYGLTAEGVQFALEQYQTVISEITHGRMSKLSYFANDILRVADEMKCAGCELQEPRVMTLDEVAKMAADLQDCMLWFEPKEIDDDMWFMAYAQPVKGGETYIDIYEFGNEVPIEAKKYLYGKTWRCWTSRPNERILEETPWE